MRAPRRHVRSGSAGGGHRSLPATLALVALALGVATFGVATDRDALTLLGLGATGLLASALAASAGRSMRGRDELRAANRELQRRNADLETRRLAIGKALDLLDDRTNGWLYELLEIMGDELADLVDESLDESTGGTL
jgi:hypothetical protein